MTRTIEYIGKQVEVTEYQPCHYFDNQKEWAAKGIPLNPNLRDGFDVTPNEERDDLEIAHWWGKPYIVTDGYRSPDDSYAAFVERMLTYGDKEEDLETEADYDLRIEEMKQNWFNAWESGIRYEIRCLNGGAWDRSTMVAMVGTLDEAIRIAGHNSNNVNIHVLEDEFINEIKILLSKNKYPMEWFTMIALGGAYEGEYSPAMRRYGDGECIYIASNKTGYKSRAAAMKKLGQMWGKAEA